MTPDHSPELAVMRKALEGPDMMLMDQIMREWNMRSPEELFDWGLQTIISRLKVMLENDRVRR